MSPKKPEIVIRNTRPEDFPQIREVSLEVYPNALPWSDVQLTSHLKVFPEGQLVAVDKASQRVLGYAASLILLWEDYEFEMNWRDFTDNGMFTNHDPENGRTLYGAEIMVRPSMQGHGIGRKLYKARRQLARRLGVLRIRAGARLRGYHHYADQMSAETYVHKVVDGELNDPTLSFQLHQGFEVLAVVANYLVNDPESRGYAALIEWMNDEVATPEDYAKRSSPFLRNRSKSGRKFS